MNMYLLVAFLLLVAMLFLVLRPFLLGTADAAAGVRVDPNDPGAQARSLAKVERVAQGPQPDGTAAVATAAELATDANETDDDATDVVAEDQDEAPASAPTSSDDVRAQVEAAIAARKAVLQAKHCTECDATVGIGDAFCRSCGTKVTA